MTRQEYTQLKPGDRVRSIHGLLYQVEALEGSAANRLVWFTLIHLQHLTRTRSAADCHLPPTVLLHTTILSQVERRHHEANA